MEVDSVFIEDWKELLYFTFVLDHIIQYVYILL